MPGPGIIPKSSIPNSMYPFPFLFPIQELVTLIKKLPRTPTGHSDCETRVENQICSRFTLFVFVLREVQPFAPNNNVKPPPPP